MSRRPRSSSVESESLLNNAEQEQQQLLDDFNTNDSRSSPPPAARSTNYPDYPPLNPDRPLHASTRAAFDEQPPSRWSRAALLIGLLIMFIVGAKLGKWGQKIPQQPEVIFASR